MTSFRLPAHVTVNKKGEILDFTAGKFRIQRNQIQREASEAVIYSTFSNAFKICQVAPTLWGAEVVAALRKEEASMQAAVEVPQRASFLN